jgi:integrase
VDFQDLADDVEHAVPKGVTRQLRAASSEAAPMSLSRVLEEYYSYKAEDSNNGLRTRIDRLRKDLILCLGKNRFEWTELKDLTRADANSYRDLLLSRMAPNSVQRNLGVVKAAINHVLLEHDLDFRNVFQAIKIKGAGSSNTDRLPITDEQLTLITPAFASSDVASSLLLLLTDTGARLAEITGLEAKDVDLDKAILHIRPNDRRGLKTKTSTRSIPLSHRATECLRQHQVGLADTDPIFPAYAKPRGNDSASAMLMKRLRTVITDKKITMHSLRHRMKDKLRNSGCPENLSMEILGHSQGSVASNYGAGYAIEVMRDALVKVWGE